MNDQVRHEGRELKARVQNKLEVAKGRMSRIDQRIQNLARNQPLAAAFMALTAGFLLGRLMSRR
jgi:ElaB/YqjD/DUF883 family membrane-anchored ribosome-binding protein